MRWPDLFERPILVVSGKGGTGKSTVAAALAATAASEGRRVLLAEVEGRGEIARTLGIPDPGFSEAVTPFGFSALSIAPGDAATEYLHIYFGMDRVSRSLVRAGIIDQLIGFVPGFRDLMVCGKLYEITHVRRSNPRDHGRPQYDLVVVDAPPTGQIASFLAAPAAFSELIRMGRMRRQATNIHRMLRRDAQLVLVSLPDEMSVAETTESLPAIAKTGVRVAALVANRCRPRFVTAGAARAFHRLDAGAVRRVAGEAGLELDAGAAGDALEDARAAEARWRGQQGFIAALERAGPTLAVPDLAVEGAAGERVAAVAAVMQGAPPPDRLEPAAVPRPGARRPAAPPPAGLAAVLDPARIVVACGSGGVGKTTISAAIAVGLAERGRRTVLLTVDPARRLSTALRLPILPGRRTTVRLARGRRMDAMQLDTQRTFDELIERYAGSPERQERILANPFYRRIADTLAGTHEYMAMEKLHDLAAEDDAEAIVIDTPPTRSALSFLEAPNRMTDFLGGRLLRWMLWPSARAGRLTLGVARMGATTFARTAGRFVGAEVLGDVADFLQAFEGMYAGFKERAAEVKALLAGPDCVFLVVTAPEEGPLEEAAYFVTRLAEGGMRAGAVVANRSHPWRAPLGPGASGALERLAGGGPEERAVAAVLATRLALEPVEAAEARAVSAFASTHGDVRVVDVPDLAGDVHDVAGLRGVADHLFAPGGRRTPGTGTPSVNDGVGAAPDGRSG